MKTWAGGALNQKIRRRTGNSSSQLEQTPQLDSPEHDQLYRTFHVKRAKDTKRKHTHQWQCKCGRWHRVLTLELQYKNFDMGKACPLCGDVPPTAGTEKQEETT